MGGFCLFLKSQYWVDVKGLVMKKWLLLLASGVAFSANSATLIPEQGLSVLYINGVETEKSIGEQHLEAGETEVIVRLDKDFGRGSSTKVYTSAPYVIKFSVSGEEVKLNHPKARSYQEAEKAFRDGSPQWYVTQDGKKIDYSQEVLPPKDGLFPYLGLDTLVADYYSDKTVQATKQQAVVLSTAEAPAVAAPTNKKVVTTNIEQLKAWYLKSSAEERKAFRKWIIDQE